MKPLPAGVGRQVRIKICGITNASDAALAIAAGADALGFNFYPGSKRYIDLESAVDWLAQVPAQVERIGIVVNPSLESAVALAALPFIDALQLHGHESPEFCRELVNRGISFSKAVAIDYGNSLGQVDDFCTKTILLDSASTNYGGSGRVLPWPVAAEFVRRRPDLRIILAGGLNADNVGRALEEVRPFGVDVTTGVEAEPGRKDPARLAAFVRAARETLC
jgi:phosphoribosylanthranilate isomerase